MAKKTYFNWSSGKDASMGLYTLLQDSNFQVDRLVTSVNKSLERVTMHGLHKQLLVEQTKSIGIPLSVIELPEKTDMETYNRLMLESTSQLINEGYTHAAFGDIFLEDLRAYREKQLESVGLNAVFPLWKKDTRELMSQFIANGFKAITVCVDAQKLDESFVGREIDENFLNDLPSNVDPCGENGEFHTFCFDGPIFDYPIKFDVGEKVCKTYEHDHESFGFWFQNLELQ